MHVCHNEYFIHDSRIEETTKLALFDYILYARSKKYIHDLHREL